MPFYEVTLSRRVRTTKKLRVQARDPVYARIRAHNMSRGLAKIKLGERDGDWCDTIPEGRVRVEGITQVPDSTDSRE